MARETILNLGQGSGKEASGSHAKCRQYSPKHVSNVPCSPTLQLLSVNCPEKAHYAEPHTLSLWTLCLLLELAGVVF